MAATVPTSVAAGAGARHNAAPGALCTVSPCKPPAGSPAQDAQATADTVVLNRILFFCWWACVILIYHALVQLGRFWLTTVSASQPAPHELVPPTDQ